MDIQVVGANTKYDSFKKQIKDIKTAIKKMPPSAKQTKWLRLLARCERDLERWRQEEEQFRRQCIVGHVYKCEGGKWFVEPVYGLPS